MMADVLRVEDVNILFMSGSGLYKLCISWVKHNVEIT